MAMETGANPQTKIHPVQQHESSSNTLFHFSIKPSKLFLHVQPSRAEKSTTDIENKNTFVNKLNKIDIIEN
jgi:hypothetical protein